MKKILIVSFVFLLMVDSSFANDAKPIEKIKRGVKNVVTSPVEIVKQTRWGWIEGSSKTFHISAWLLSGVVKGVAFTVGRIGSGFVDIATFPINTHSLMSPDNVFSEWPKRQEGVVYKQFGEK